MTDQARVSGWRIALLLSDGREFALNGAIYRADPDGEVIAVVDAMAAGLRAAGYEPVTTLTRTHEETR